MNVSAEVDLLIVGAGAAGITAARTALAFGATCLVLEAREARANARDERRAQRCRCGDDMPGHCPGPANCPMCADDEEDDA